MAFQNRVAPTGALHAVPAKGTLMGNRGILTMRRAGSSGPTRIRTG